MTRNINYLDSLISDKNFDIIALVERWIHKSVHISLLSGYTYEFVSSIVDKSEEVVVYYILYRHPKGNMKKFFLNW